MQTLADPTSRADVHSALAQWQSMAQCCGSFKLIYSGALGVRGLTRNRPSLAGDSRSLSHPAAAAPTSARLRLHRDWQDEFSTVWRWAWTRPGDSNRRTRSEVCLGRRH
eukprot:286129-Rhodomonas_salina.2